MKIYANKTNILRGKKMAEFCKECFKNKILTPQERKEIADEQIVMFPVKDLCEGCGELKFVVDYVALKD